MILPLKNFVEIIAIIIVCIIVENSECSDFIINETITLTTTSPDITTSSSNENLLNDLRNFILNLKQNPLDDGSNVSVDQSPPFTTAEGKIIDEINTEPPLIIPKEVKHPPSIEIEKEFPIIHETDKPPPPPPAIRRGFRRPILRKTTSPPEIEKVTMPPKSNSTETPKIFRGLNRPIPSRKFKPPSSTESVVTETPTISIVNKQPPETRRRRPTFLRRPTTIATTTISPITETQPPSITTLSEMEQSTTESTTITQKVTEPPPTTTPFFTTVNDNPTITTDDQTPFMTTITTKSPRKTKSRTGKKVPEQTKNVDLVVVSKTNRPISKSNKNCSNDWSCRGAKTCNDDDECNNHNAITTTGATNNGKNDNRKTSRKNSNRSRSRNSKKSKKNGKRISSTSTTKKKAAEQIQIERQPHCEMVVCELPCYIFKSGTDVCPECSCPEANSDRIQFIATSGFEPAFRLSNKRNQSRVFRLN